MRLMFTLAHLSDPHLAPLPPARLDHLVGKRLLGYLNWHRRRGMHRPEALEAIVTDLHEQAPDHIAVTGDLVNLALPAEFPQALAWLRQLGKPAEVSVIPGNHDAYAPLWRGAGIRLWTDYSSSNEAGAAYIHASEAPFPYVRMFGRVAMIGTSTARATAPFMASGRLGSAQLRRLDRVLEALGKEKIFRVLLIHHPPVPGMGGWRRSLHDARALGAVLKRRGVELVLHGHEHRYTLNWLKGPQGVIPAVGAPSASASPSQTKTNAPRAKPLAGYHVYRIMLATEGSVIEMTRRGLIEGGAGVGILEETRISPVSSGTQTMDVLREND